LGYQPRHDTSAARNVEDALTPMQPGRVEQRRGEGRSDRRDEVPFVVLSRVPAILLERDRRRRCAHFFVLWSVVLVVVHNSCAASARGGALENDLETRNADRNARVRAAMNETAPARGEPLNEALERLRLEAA